MNLELEGKVAFITGGSMGIGKDVGKAIVKAGGEVAIAARGVESLEKAADEIEKEAGKRPFIAPCDVTSTEAMFEATQKTFDNFGRLDILLNGAAAPSGMVRGHLDEANPDDLLTDIDIKVVGYFRAAKACAPHMRKNNYGRIINLGGLTGRGSKVISGLRNVAIVHMTKTLSDYLGPDGITVNCIHPGVVETPHIRELYDNLAKQQGITAEQVKQNFIKDTPIRRILGVEDIANVVLFLSSPAGSAITGESLGVDGGITRGIFL